MPTITYFFVTIYTLSLTLKGRIPYNLFSLSPLCKIVRLVFKWTVLSSKTKDDQNYHLLTKYLAFMAYKHEDLVGYYIPHPLRYTNATIKVSKNITKKKNRRQSEMCQLAIIPIIDIYKSLSNPVAWDKVDIQFPGAQRRWKNSCLMSAPAADSLASRARRRVYIPSRYCYYIEN